MSKTFIGGSVAMALSIATIGTALGVGTTKAAASDDNVTEDQIVRALAPPARPLTRSLSAGPQVDPAAAAAEGTFINNIRNRTTRSLSTGEREQIATIAKDKPNIDLEINFDYNSAAISARSLPSVQALGKALTSPDLKGSTFVVAGYTDAAGGVAYNQELSERRADAIKHYLTGKFGIAGRNLVTVGYGKTKLKNPSEPLSSVNRRVKVVNLQNKDAASR